MRPTCGPARSEADLQGILALQQQNLPVVLTPQEQTEQGFVTVQHDLPLLRKMNAPHPHSIAKAGSRVVGYALVMQRSLARDIPVLVPLFEHIDALSYAGQPLALSQYCVMGQVCVAHAYRGKGIFADLYQHLQQALAPHFDYLITKIDRRNTRSLRAHARVGFQSLHDYQAKDGVQWRIVLLELGNS